MRHLAAALGFCLLLACGPGQASDGEDGAVEADWSSCVLKDDNPQTCAEVCAARGVECIPEGCPAETESCDPAPCDNATQVLALDSEALCADPSQGIFVASTCEAPIDWLFSNTLRCCCGDPD